MHHILHDVMIIIVLETAPLLQFTQLKELPTCRPAGYPKIQLQLSSSYQFDAASSSRSHRSATRAFFAILKLASFFFPLVCVCVAMYMSKPTSSDLCCSMVLFQLPIIGGDAFHVLFYNADSQVHIVWRACPSCDTMPLFVSKQDFIQSSYVLDHGWPYLFGLLRCERTTALALFRDVLRHRRCEDARRVSGKL